MEGSEDALSSLRVHGGERRRWALAAELENLVTSCRRAIAARESSTASDCLAAAWAVLDLQGPRVAALALTGELTAVRRQAVFDFAKWYQHPDGDAAGRYLATMDAKRRAAIPADVRKRIQRDDHWFKRAGVAVTTAFAVLVSSRDSPSHPTKRVRKP